MPKSPKNAGDSTSHDGPWTPFWVAVRQAADELRQARAASQMPTEEQE